MQTPSSREYPGSLPERASFNENRHILEAPSDIQEYLKELERKTDCVSKGFLEKNKHL
jgi:hypothetical protein